MKILNNKLFVIGLLVFLSIVVIALSFYMVYMLNTKEECFCENNNDLAINTDTENSEEISNAVYVEVKGAVANPGVFLMNDTDIINDAITLAGGLNENAYTDNINLSKKVSDELVIYVYTEVEYKRNNASVSDKVTTSNSACSTNSYTIDNCTKSSFSIITSGGTDNSVATNNDNVTSSTDASTSLVNINLATVAELTTLPGIGETKANNIITYRTENGYFTSIEDLKNVSGIGDATFEQLKAYITV